MLLNDKLFTAELNILNINNVESIALRYEYLNIYYYSEVKVNGLNVSSGN